MVEKAKILDMKIKACAIQVEKYHHLNSTIWFELRSLWPACILFFINILNNKLFLYLLIIDV